MEAKKVMKGRGKERDGDKRRMQFIRSIFL